MKCVFRIPESDIQPRDSSTPARAYVMRSSPAPPCSSGTVRPNSPSSFIPSTIFSGNSSSCSSSSATGMTSRSTNSRTVSTTAFCSSVNSMRPPPSLPTWSEPLAGSHQDFVQVLVSVHPGRPPPHGQLLGHLAGGLVDQLGAEHHRALPFDLGGVEVGLEDRFGLVEFVLGGGEH